MPETSSQSIATRLRNLTTELRALDHDLKSNSSPSGTTLREFRQALDNVRMTAWTVNELLNARQTQKDPAAVISFLTAERLRRFNQMVRDLCVDLEREGAKWSVEGIQDVHQSINLLREQLGKLARRSAVPKRPRDV